MKPHFAVIHTFITNQIKFNSDTANNPNKGRAQTVGFMNDTS